MLESMKKELIARTRKSKTIVYFIKVIILSLINKAKCDGLLLV